MKIVDLPKKDNFTDFMKAMSEIAKANKVYYDSLIKEGFTEQQALQIVMTFKWF